jgi:hypothetical protein
MNASVKGGHAMKVSSIRAFILALAIAATGGSGTSLAQSESLTGCLNLRSGGKYILTEEKAKRAVIVIGPVADLKPHGHNHRVTVTGTLTKDEGQEVFKASAIQHLDEKIS